MFTAKVFFSPPLTASGGASNPSVVRGKLPGCLSSDPSVEIRVGRLKGTFSPGFGTGCAFNGTQSATFTLSWRGRVDGTIGGTFYGGKAHFTSTTQSFSAEQVITDQSGHRGFALPGSTGTSTSTGSFAGSTSNDRSATAYTTLTPAALTAACNQPKGLKSITLSGAITIGPGVVEPSSIVSGPDGALWFTNVIGNGRVTTTGTLSNYTDPGAIFDSGITAGPDGALWFTSTFGNAIGNSSGNSFGSIGRLTTSGDLTTFTDPSISLPEGITTGPDGAIWFTNAGSNTIGRITTAGAVSNYPDPSVNASPSAITSGPDGALWITNTGSNSIVRMTTSGIPTFYYSLDINGPFGITSGPDGALWYTNSGNNTIGRITTLGVTSSFSDPSTNFPAGITSGPDGALWYTNEGFPFPVPPGFGFSAPPSSIGRISTGGAVSNYTDPSIDGPAGITTGPDGALWFTNNFGGSIGRITTSGAVTNFG